MRLYPALLCCTLLLSGCNTFTQFAGDPIKDDTCHTDTPLLSRATLKSMKELRASYEKQPDIPPETLASLAACTGVAANTSIS